MIAYVGYDGAFYDSLYWSPVVLLAVPHSASYSATEVPRDDVKQILMVSGVALESLVFFQNDASHCLALEGRNIATVEVVVVVLQDCSVEEPGAM